MTTSIPSTTPPTAERGPLRLRLTPTGTTPRPRLDGAWWPRSRDLPSELADLVDHFPAEAGRVARAVFSPPDWEAAPRRIRIARGTMKIGSFPRDDTHLMQLTLLGGASFELLVVPPETPQARAAELLDAGSRAGNTRPAAELLRQGAPTSP